MSSNATAVPDYTHLPHFVMLAKRGAGGGASGGESRAALLADAVLEYVPGLDQNAAQGLCAFIRIASASYDAANHLLH